MENNKFWSFGIQTLVPYVPGEQCAGTDWIKLNTNECVLGPSKNVLVALAQEMGSNLRMYPDPEAKKLRQAIGVYYDVGIEQIFVGNGSDEVLAHVFCALLKHELPLLFPDISYNFYAAFCALYDIQFKKIPLTANFRIDVESYTCTNGGIILANPNAPTGRALALREIEQLLHANRNSVVVIDEAYVDFGASSAVSLIHRFPNLLVVQTLSKSRGLAGLRVGFAMGHAHLIEALHRVKNSFNSYPLGALALAGATAAIQDTQHLADVVAINEENRTFLNEGLFHRGFEVLPSAANFVFARHQEYSGLSLAQALRQRKILIRHFDQPRISDFLRITVGSKAQCVALLQGLDEIR